VFFWGDLGRLAADNDDDIGLLVARESLVSFTFQMAS